MPKSKMPDLQAVKDEPPDDEEDEDDYDEDYYSEDDEDDDDAYASAHRGCTCARCLRSAGPPREDGESHISSIQRCLKVDAYRGQNAALVTDEQHYERACALWLSTNENCLAL